MLPMRYCACYGLFVALALCNITLALNMPLRVRLKTPARIDNNKNLINNIRRLTIYQSSRISVCLSAASSSNTTLDNSSYNNLKSVANIESQGPNDLKSIWPCGDTLDKKIMALVGPAILNFAMVPLVGFIDTFWVGQMNQALPLAGQGAANRVFSSAFWIISFLPTIVTPLVASAAAANDKEEVQKHVSNAVVMGFIVGGLGSLFIMRYTDLVLSLVQSKDSPALQYARPYLFIRAITFIPSLFSTIGFSVFRGTLDVITPLKIGILSNAVNIILDPLFIFKFGWGVSGAAWATCAAELVSCILFGYALISRGIMNPKTLYRLPSIVSLKPLLLGSVAVLLRSFALEVNYNSLMNRAQSLDRGGVIAAAHAISLQLWDIGSYLLYAIGVVSTVLVPTEFALASTTQSPEQAQRRGRDVANRMLAWGVLSGTLTALVQLASLPVLKQLSPIKAIQDATLVPVIIGAALHIVSGVTFVGEGIQMGNQEFASLAVTTVVGMFAMLVSLRVWGGTLPGIWIGFAAMMSTRMLGTLLQYYKGKPLKENC